MLHRRVSKPNVSNSVITAQLDAGMPGIVFSVLCVAKGNAISEPISTRGDCSALAFNASAKNTMGGIPTPPPSKRGSDLSGDNSKLLPIGPRLCSCRQHLFD